MRYVKRPRVFAQITIEKSGYKFNKNHLTISPLAPRLVGPPPPAAATEDCRGCSVGLWEAVEAARTPRYRPDNCTSRPSAWPCPQRATSFSIFPRLQPRQRPPHFPSPQGPCSQRHPPRPFARTRPRKRRPPGSFVRDDIPHEPFTRSQRRGVDHRDHPMI